MTRKLIESTFVTLDGVIGDPQIWGPPYWDDEHAAYAAKLLDTHCLQVDNGVRYSFRVAARIVAGTSAWSTIVTTVPRRRNRRLRRHTGAKARPWRADITPPHDRGAHVRRGHHLIVDIGTSFTVAGSDAHGFDDDGDGQNCDSYG